MVELTTGVVFLMSALYGAGQGDSQVDKIHANLNDNGKTEIAETRTFKASKEVESYVREEFADAPILIEIARCESTFKHFDENGKPIRGKTNKQDIGVMQINQEYNGDAAKKLGYDIETIQGNVAFAKYLYDKFGAQPWSASAPCWAKAGSLAKK